MTIHYQPTDPITTGDTAISVYYRLMDSDGRTSRSPQAITADALVWNEGTSINASGQWLRIPTLRHLLPGTVAEIEVFIERDGADLQLYWVLANDPTVDYVDFCVNMPNVVDLAVMPTVKTAVEATGVGEVDPSTGDALQNDPPPQCDCIAVWRNRAFACRGKDVFPSLEFDQSGGLRFPTGLRIRWEEGTGPITAVCPIDWNYLAIFKQDAIGIISGPGPDGLGHGNYIVQTLPTKMGTTKPKSVCNGDTGCYFQDASTLRLAVVTPQLQVAECAPGWFNNNTAEITWARQIEQRRAVWFATTERQIIVLDYKHKTDRCPFGQAFVWDLSSLGLDIAGIEVFNGMPQILFTDGSIGEYHETYVFDQGPGHGDEPPTYPILMVIETGEMQPFSLQGMGDVSRIQMLGEYLSAHGLRLTTYPQFSTSGTPVSKTLTAGPEQVGTRPPNCQRVQSLRVKIEELTTTSGTPPAVVLGKGFKFVGFAMEVKPRGRLQTLDVGGMI